MEKEKRKGYKDISSQLQADKRWIQKNKEHRNYLSQRGACRSFIKNKSKLEDLEEIEILIDDRKKILNKFT